MRFVAETATLEPSWRLHLNDWEKKGIRKMHDLNTLRYLNGETRSPEEILRESRFTLGEWKKRQRGRPLLLASDSTTPAQEEEQTMQSPMTASRPEVEAAKPSHKVRESNG